MSKLQSFLEDKLRIRIKGIPSRSNQIPLIDTDKDLASDLKNMDSMDVTNMSDLNKFRTLSSNRDVQYRMYDEMTEDSIIASALEMYADDATQYNSNGQVIWAESENNDVSAFANRLIDVLDLNSNAWSHIYSMIKYGDLYLETFRDDELLEDEDDPLISRGIASVKTHKIGSQMQEYIETVIDPSEIFDLTKRGKTIGFIKVPNHMNESSKENAFGYQYIQQGEEVTVLPSDKYVHVCLANNTDRYQNIFKLQFRDSTRDNGIKECEYTIKRGKSILHDLYKIYKEISLLEDALLLNRINKSSLIRILQIEVGDMPKAQARELLKRVKTLIEQKNFMNKDEGTYGSMTSPGPIENVIYVPTHDGKGAISSSNLGGDVDVKSIIDVDYFKNKLYAGLKIPKQFLGEDDGGGFSGGTSLTKLDARYARTIKRVQNAYISGITTLINLFAISKGLLDHVNNFTIKMQSPSTTEDSERDETLNNRVSIIGSIMDILSDDILSNGGKKEIIINMLNNMLNLPDIAKILEDDIVTDENNEESTEDINSDTGYSGSFGGFESSDIDSEDITPEEEENSNEENRDVFDNIESIPDTDDNKINDNDNNGFGNFENEA